MQLIRGFLRELRRKRYAKAFRRFTVTRSRKMDLSNEATELMKREVFDKGLNRANYYEENEPDEFVSTYTLKQIGRLKLRCVQILKNFLPSSENPIDECPQKSCAQKVSTIRE